MQIKTKKEYYGIITLLGLLTGLIPFSVDMYLPGFPAIAAGLGTDVAAVGISLASFFIGVCLGQLIYGPLMDRFGRKLPLLVGMGIYILATVGCIYSTSVEQLIIYRLIQALGGCAGMVASRAAVRDLFPLAESAKVFSMLMLVMGSAPIIAPSIGSLVLTSFNWQAIFMVLGLITLALFAGILLFLPESKAPDATVSLNPVKIFREYGEVIKNPIFLVYTLVASFSSAAMFTYISSSPFVFMKLYHLSESQYGIAFGFNACCLIIGSQLNRFLLLRKSSVWITYYSGFALFFMGSLLALVTFLHRDTLSITLFFISTSLLLIGVINPNTSALSLAPFTKNAGMAAAFSGFFQMALSAVSAFSVSYFYNGTSMPMAVILALNAFLSLLCLSILQPSKNGRI